MVVRETRRGSRTNLGLLLNIHNHETFEDWK